MNSRMNHQVFVPFTDDILYDHPEQIDGPLVPYRTGVECHHWLSIELNPKSPPPVNRIKTMKNVLTRMLEQDDGDILRAH